MDIRQLEAFASTARHRSFSEAAKELYLSQPTVSAHIRALEQELHVRLINRTTKGFELTGNGRRLFAYAQRILELREKALHEISAERSGILQIGASSVPGIHILPDMLGEFHRLSPNLQFRLHISDSIDVIRRVTEGSLELGLVGTRTKNPSCVFQPLFTDELVLILPNTPYYQELLKEEKPLPRLLSEPFVLREESSGTRAELEHFLSGYGKSLRDLKIVAYINSNSALIESVSGGLGVSVVSRSAAKNALNHGRLLACPLGEDALMRTFYLVYGDRLLLTSAALRFIDFACRFRQEEGSSGPSNQA